MSNAHPNINFPALRGATPELIRLLLGRDERTTERALPDGYLSSARVLVTGAGGSIGSELCRQLRRLQPAELLMLDRDESALHAVKLSIDGEALMNTPDLILADLRDGVRMREVFEQHRPDTIFHAAALKHLPILELAPTEAVSTNVTGTADLLDLACEFGVETFVNISTDKAANPTSVLGYSKRVAERITAEVGARASGRYLSVRFGNVLGSRGSLLETFLAQIDAGGPVTVTSPQIRRYFMSVDEAVHLVLHASVDGFDGHCHVLEMGDQLLIKDVAERLIARSGRAVEILYVGMRQGEKLLEELFNDIETPQLTSHPHVTAVLVPPLARVSLERLVTLRDPAAVRAELHRLSYSPANDTTGSLAAGG